MRVAIDARPALDPRRTGVGQYAQQLIRHLPLADPDDEAASERPDPEGSCARGEARDALRLALDRLSSEQRSAIVLTYFHDLPYAEIAQIMDCPVDTVKTRMFHGRRRLRALLSGEPGDWL